MCAFLGPVIDSKNFFDKKIIKPLFSIGLVIAYMPNPVDVFMPLNPGEDPFGYSIDLYSWIAEKRKFDVTFKRPADELYGSFNSETGIWDGALGMLQRSVGGISAFRKRSIFRLLVILQHSIKINGSVSLENFFLGNPLIPLKG